MNYIFMVVILFVVVAALVFLKFLNLSASLTTAIIFLLILFAIFSLAWVQPKEIKTK